MIISVEAPKRLCRREGRLPSVTSTSFLFGEHALEAGGYSSIVQRTDRFSHKRPETKTFLADSFQKRADVCIAGLPHPMIFDQGGLKSAGSMTASQSVMLCLKLICREAFIKPTTMEHFGSLLSTGRSSSWLANPHVTLQLHCCSSREDSRTGCAKRNRFLQRRRSDYLLVELGADRFASSILGKVGCSSISAGWSWHSLPGSQSATTFGCDLPGRLPPRLFE